MRRQYRDDGYHPRSEVCGQKPRRMLQLLQLYFFLGESMLKNWTLFFFLWFELFSTCFRGLVVFWPSAWGYVTCIDLYKRVNLKRKTFFDLSALPCILSLKCSFIFPSVASFSMFATASPGLQPGQFDQEKQRAGVTHGETHPDLSTCRGQSDYHCPTLSVTAYVV